MQGLSINHSAVSFARSAIRKLVWVGLPFVVLGLISACSQPELYEGRYVEGFEMSVFTPCGSQESWWIAPNEELSRAYSSLGVAPYTEVYVQLKGTRSKRGSYGHLGAYPYEFQVHEIVSIDTVIPITCR